MKSHTDGVLLARRLGLGPIGSATHKLSMPTDNQAGDLTEATRVTTTCIDAGPQASHLAPVASYPSRAAGAPLFVPCHTQEKY